MSMCELSAYMLGLAVVAGFGLFFWPVSIIIRNTSIVDSLWSIFFVLAACSYALVADTGPRALLVLALVTIWGVRLSGYITWRNWGKGEDYRYAAMRERNQPFAWKSLYIVFLLQAGLAWFISLPLFGSITGMKPFGLVDVLGCLLFLIGFFFESVGDFQLAFFKAKAENTGKVMDRGLWRYTRHPNYFGDFCVWWGFYLLALGAGAWWSLPAPLLMSFLLLKVSGVSLLEKDIGERRPAYANYARRTNAFFPGLPKAGPSYKEEQV
jgi:steroid 5-alpha reductase family enzyme